MPFRNSDGQEVVYGSDFGSSYLGFEMPQETYYDRAKDKISVGPNFPLVDKNDVVDTGSYPVSQGDVHAGQRQQKMDYYEQLGNALMQMMQGPKQQESGGNYQSNLTQGFDSDWLMSQTNAGSANGGTIGGGGGGGGGGGSKKGMSGPQGGWGDSGGMGGFSMGSTSFA